MGELKGEKGLVERASKGGQARREALSSEQRSESARKAVRARWAKARTTPTEVSVYIEPARGLSDKIVFNMEINKQFHDEPKSNAEVPSWNLNSPFSVTMQYKTESSMQ